MIDKSILLLSEMNLKRDTLAFSKNKSWHFLLLLLLGCMYELETCIHDNDGKIE